MPLVLTSPEAAAAPPRPIPSFQIGRSQNSPTYHQLSLADALGYLAHWVIPLPIKHLAKRPMLLWLLPGTSQFGAFTCLDAGPMQLAPAHPGSPPNLPADLREGVLRLHFSGQLLRGYFRLQCLPEGSGQLWQLTPIGHV